MMPLFPELHKINRGIARALRSRTIWLGLAMVAAGALQAFEGWYQEHLTPEAQGWLTSAVGVAIVWLRTLTRQALTDEIEDG